MLEVQNLLKRSHPAGDRAKICNLDLSDIRFCFYFAGLCWLSYIVLLCLLVSFCFCWYLFQRMWRYYFQLALFFAMSSDYLLSSSVGCSTFPLDLEVGMFLPFPHYSEKKKKKSIYKQIITLCILSFLPLPLTDWHLTDIFFPTHL